MLFELIIVLKLLEQVQIRSKKTELAWGKVGAVGGCLNWSQLKFSDSRCVTFIMLERLKLTNNYSFNLTRSGFSLNGPSKIGVLTLYSNLKMVVIVFYLAQSNYFSSAKLQSELSTAVRTHF